ncbi:MAG: hypothetical protein ACE5HI_13885 [bacterium]
MRFETATEGKIIVFFVLLILACISVFGSSINMRIREHGQKREQKQKQEKLEKLEKQAKFEKQEKEKEKKEKINLDQITTLKLLNTKTQIEKEEANIKASNATIILQQQIIQQILIDFYTKNRLDPRNWSITFDVDKECGCLQAKKVKKHIMIKTKENKNGSNNNNR